MNEQEKRKVIDDFAIKNGITASVGRLLFPYPEFTKTADGETPDHKLVAELLLFNEVPRMTDGKSEFINPELISQFCHSDCYAVAEYLLYAFHEIEGVTVNYIHWVYACSIHALVEVIYKGNTYYIDAGGVYDSMEPIFSRYSNTLSGCQSLSDVTIERYLGADVIDECDNSEIAHLTGLTSVRTFTMELAEYFEVDSGEEVLESALYKAMILLINEPYI